MAIRDIDVIRAYILLRKKKEALAKQQKEELDEIKDKMNKLEAYMLAKLGADGADSCKTSSGTAFMKENTYINISDKEAFLTFVREQDMQHMMATSASKDAVLSYVESHGEPPPGITITKELVCQFRSPK